jgi:molybdopterin/thiamine biosynthesis adenylyltransferase
MSARDDIFDEVPQWDQARVRAARVLVVGAGALGNEVLKNLALLNVQRIADADAHRYKAEVAAERLLEINPELQLLTLLGDVVTDLSLGLLAEVDVVIGCVDNRLARLYLNRLCWRAGKPWVDGGILNLAGQVAAYVPGHSCYECGLSAVGWQEIRQRLGCTDMARRYALDGHAPTTPIAASIIGAMQVQEALKLVLGLQGQSLAGQMYSYEGAYNLGAVYDRKPLRAECDSHFEATVPIATPLARTSTLTELFDYLRNHLQMAAPTLLLDHSVTTALASLHGHARVNVLLPVHHFSDRLAQEILPGDLLGIPKGALLEVVRPGDLDGKVPLWALGIPAGHMLRVGRVGERRLIHLAGDAQAFRFAPGVRQLSNDWWQPSVGLVRMYGKE